MVFNNGFDNTIWMILSSDKKYRNEIAEFIYSLPKELYDLIFGQLIEYKYDDMDENYEFKTFKRLIRDKDEINNFYSVEMCPYKIKINLKRWDSARDKLNEDIELLIYYSDISIFNEIEDSVSLGKYSYKCSKFLNPFSSCLTVKGDLREYEIYDTDDNNLMIGLTDDGELCSGISINNIPEELYLCDLKDRRSVKRLVKGRKNK